MQLFQRTTRLFLNQSPLTTHLRYNFIIGRLFRKKVAQPISKNNEKNDNVTEEKKQEDEPQQEIDLYDRRKQVYTNVDYRKLREQESAFIPEDIGSRGGFNELVYWTQKVKTPQQIVQLMQKFNNEPIPQQLQHQHHFNQFKQKVKSTVSLAHNINVVCTYCMFGYKFQIDDQDFWKNIQERVVRARSLNQQQIKACIDIVFLMSKCGKGQYIYNQIQQYLTDLQGLNLRQMAKLSSAFSIMKAGKKEWIQKLFNVIFTKIDEFDGHSLAQAAPAFKSYKGFKSEYYQKIEKRILQIQDSLTFNNIAEICPLFGTNHGSYKMWELLQKKTTQSLVSRKKGLRWKEVYTLFQSILNCYRFSTQFVQKYGIPALQKDNFEVLKHFKPTVLSTISKVLYIYELQGKTAHIQKQIQKRIIEQFRNLDNAHPWALIDVIKDYTVTGHGTRDLYKFLQEVVRATLDDIMQDREALEALIVIYEHSGLCSEDTLAEIKGLL